MAYMVSPGIQVKEYDISGYVPGVSSSVGAIAGVFRWGPCEQAQLISNEGDLISRFGLPDDNNFETFMIASNFLSYSSSLFVSRVADDFALNSIVSSDKTRTSSNIQIKNYNEFIVKNSSLDNDILFTSKYPGKLANDLRISICPNRDAYEETITIKTGYTFSMEIEPGKLSANVVVTDLSGNATFADNELKSFIGKLNIGDYIKFDQYWLKLTEIDTTSTLGTDKAQTTFIFATHFPGALKVTITNSLTRRWEFASLFDRAPSTSSFVNERGGFDDEMHVVVVDRSGKFSGTPNQVIEIFTSVSRAKDAKSENGTVNYFKDVLNDNSQYVFVNPNIQISGILEDDAHNIQKITEPVFNGDFVGGIDTADESTISLGAMARAYDVFKSREQIDISLIIAGKSIGGSNGEGLANYIIDNIAEVRKDCIVSISPPLTSVVGNVFNEVSSLINFRRSLRYSGFASLTTSYKLQYDRYNQKNRWVAGCGDDAGLMARTDMERDPWWSHAGENRGKYKNIIRLSFSPDQAARDELYKEDINPVVNLIGAGVMLYGDKTLLGKPSAFDRIPVRRLFNILEKAIEKAVRQLLFERNDIYTRSRFINLVEPFLRDVMGRRGIVRYQVVCDENNNPPVVIDRNEFVGSIYVVPSKSINFITLNFVAVANAVDFSYAIGEVDGIVS